MTLRIPIICWAHTSLSRKASRELPTRSSLLFNFPWVFTLFLSHTQPLQWNPTNNARYIRLNIITTKFGTELQPTQNSCKSQLYSHPLWLFRDKTPKTDSRLKREFGNSGKNSLTPNLEVVKHLHVYTCNLKHLHTNKNFIKLMTSWIQGMYTSKYSAIKIVNIRYHVIKNLIKQDQSLKIDYNEHLASKCSSGHANKEQSLIITCMSNTWPMQNTWSICI